MFSMRQRDFRNLREVCLASLTVYFESLKKEALV